VHKAQRFFHGFPSAIQAAFKHSWDAVQVCPEQASRLSRVQTLGRSGPGCPTPSIPLTRDLDALLVQLRLSHAHWPSCAPPSIERVNKEFKRRSKSWSHGAQCSQDPPGLHRAASDSDGVRSHRFSQLRQRQTTASTSRTSKCVGDFGCSRPRHKKLTLPRDGGGPPARSPGPSSAFYEQSDQVAVAQAIDDKLAPVDGSKQGPGRRSPGSNAHGPRLLGKLGWACRRP